MKSVEDWGGRSLSEPHVRRRLWFAYLAPDIVEVIVEGRQPRSLTMSSCSEGSGVAGSPRA
jgi:hypothetical protein